MNKKLNVTIKVIKNVDCKYLHWRESKGEDLTLKKVIFFVFEFFEWINVLRFHALAILFWEVDKWDI